MKLLSITVSGFKNIKKTKLRTDGIISIVSPNNYGKSNLLDAIDFGIDFISSSPKDRQKMMAWTRGIPISRTLSQEDFYFEIEFYDPSLAEYQYVRYGYTFSWYKDDSSGQRILDEWLDARPNESVRYTSFLKRAENKYRKSKETISYRKIKVDNNQLIVELLAAQNIPLQKVASSINKIDYHICSSLDLGDRFQSMPIEYAGSPSEDGIAFDDEDVPRALYHLKQSNPEKYSLFLEAIFTLFPEFTDLKVQAYELKKEELGLDLNETSQKVAESDGKNESSVVPFRIRDELYRILINDKNLNQPINMSLMSTGTKRIMWLLANVFIASTKHYLCIGIEELETSIHPKLLKALLEILDETLDDTTLIISSHSPYLIQYFKPEKIYIGVPTHDGTACFKSIKASNIKNMLKLAADHDMPIGEYLFELMTGDQDSAEVLSFFLEG